MEPQHPLPPPGPGRRSPGARRALDVGTGNGLLAAELRGVVPHVVGLDPDAAVLESARREDPGVSWVQGDLMTHPFAAGSFDLVASIATMHHLPDLDEALLRLAELVAPGGVLAVVGVGRSSGLVDFGFELTGVLQHRALSRRHGWWEHSAPTVWPPPFTHADARRSAERVLPGAVWRRFPLWRHLILWTRPTAEDRMAQSVDEFYGDRPVPPSIGVRRARAAD